MTMGGMQWWKTSDFLAVSSKGRIHCGEIARDGDEAGHDFISACTVQAMSQALAIAVKHGVKPVGRSRKPRSRTAVAHLLMAMQYPGMLAGDFEPPFHDGEHVEGTTATRSLWRIPLGSIAGDLRCFGRVGAMCEDGCADLDSRRFPKRMKKGPRVDTDKRGWKML